MGITSFRCGCDVSTGRLVEQRGIVMSEMHGTTTGREPEWTPVAESGSSIHTSVAPRSCSVDFEINTKFDHRMTTKVNHTNYPPANLLPVRASQMHSLYAFTFLVGYRLRIVNATVDLLLARMNLWQPSLPLCPRC